ncbi:hypothetical protein ETAA8_52490 [Anatilimnocola aggregata]|uniref:DUF1501 domain-containing protein n=1 Tax=Anatilimnocola aggregata TaxID=2528021 RepID=A0A517YIS5_9BACT|nr:DUF1501 domain-containing protein [Anatilimnocola aggregata]QDU30130.1 hypothetical protein ETAA8_52490 [Anatilimnocola aggregata]
MLTFHDGNSRFGRRDFLRVGGLALGGLTLPQLLAQREALAGSANSKAKGLRDRSVIFVFLHGGPSQIETFDPKMTAPAGVRSATGEISTKLPGITFGSTFSRLASMNDKFSIVRSFRTGDANHDIKPIVGKHTMGANMGSLYSRIAGTNHPVTGMPMNAALFPRAVDPSTQAEQNKFGKFASTGSLGTAYAPFSPGGEGNFQKDLELRLSRDRVEDRRNLLAGLDRLQRGLDSDGNLLGADRLQQQAFQTVLGGIAKAFDLSTEDAKTVARYDTAPLVRPNQINPKWKNYNNYVDNAKSLGKLLLLARRLCETGCGFVTVTTNFVWDMHADVNNTGVEEGMQYMGNPLDYALSALIDDLHERGLSEKVLVVVCGEMGRTPRINKNGGRDHWGGLSPLLLSGGGLNMGQVIGQSTDDAGEPHTEPQELDNLLATVMHSLFDLGQVRLMTGMPQDLVRAITTPKPITGLT